MHQGDRNGPKSESAQPPSGFRSRPLCRPSPPGGAAAAHARQPDPLPRLGRALKPPPKTRLNQKQRSTFHRLPWRTHGARTRLQFVLPLILSISGCHYMLDANLDPNQPNQPTQPTVPDLLAPTDYYVSVIAEAEPVKDTSPASVCSRSFALPLVLSTNATAISLSAVLGPTDTGVPIPLYTVNSDTSLNTCDIQYSERYILPHNRFAPDQLFVINAKYLYQTTGKEGVSAYLSAGKDLATAMAPAGTPALATATIIMNSPLVQKIDSAINSGLLSSGTSLSKPLVSFNFHNVNQPISQAVRLLIQQVPLDFNRNPSQVKQ